MSLLNHKFWTERFSFIIIISIFSMFILLLISGCPTQKQIRREDLKARSDRVFSDLEREEKREGILKSDNQKYEEEELSKRPESLDKKAETKEVLFNKEVIDFEEVGEGSAYKYERNIDAERRAEEDALSKAMKKAGTDIFYGFNDVLAQYGKTQYQFVSHYLFTFSSGLSEWERIGNPVFSQLEDGGVRCRLRIRGRIYLRGRPDPAFEIRFDLKDEKLGLDKPAYYSGDEVTLSFWVTKDSYITVLNIDEEQNVSLIYPNKYSKITKIRAGEIFRIPDNPVITLKALLPPGRNETMELLHIIATKRDPLFSPEETREMLTGGYKTFSLGEFNNVVKRLARLERSEWCSYVVSYIIKSR